MLFLYLLVAALLTFGGWVQHVYCWYSKPRYKAFVVQTTFAFTWPLWVFVAWLALLLAVVGYAVLCSRVLYTSITNRK